MVWLDLLLAHSAWYISSIFVRFTLHTNSDRFSNTRIEIPKRTICEWREERQKSVASKHFWVFVCRSLCCVSNIVCIRATATVISCLNITINPFTIRVQNVECVQLLVCTINFEFFFDEVFNFYLHLCTRWRNARQIRSSHYSFVCVCLFVVFFSEISFQSIHHHE